MVRYQDEPVVNWTPTKMQLSSKQLPIRIKVYKILYLLLSLHKTSQNWIYTAKSLI